MTFSDPTNYQLPGAKHAQQQVFGEYSKKDIADYSQAAYNYLTHQQDNALAIALMNYQNQYNSPQNQMLLRQQAGINPYSDYAVQAGASANMAASPAVRSNSNYVKQQQANAQKINTFMQALETGTKIADYMIYGRDLSKYQLDAAIGRSGILSEQLQQEVMRTGQMAWYLGYPGYEQIGSSPYGKLQSAQTHNYAVNEERVKAYKSQIDYLVKELYPAQKDQIVAKQQLEEQKYGIQDAQYGAVTRINTGNATVDGILQFLLMSFRDLLRIGITGRMF